MAASFQVLQHVRSAAVFVSAATNVIEPPALYVTEVNLAQIASTSKRMQKEEDDFTEDGLWKFRFFNLFFQLII